MINLSEFANGHRALPAWAVMVPSISIGTLIIIGFQGGSTGFIAILGWVGFGFLLITALYLTVVMGGSAVVSSGLRKAARELSYLGYRREREWQRSNLTVTITHVIPQALKSRSRFLAFVSYKLNAIFFSDTNSNLRVVPIEPSQPLTQVSQAGTYPETIVGSKVPYTAQSDIKLNDVLFATFNVTKELHETQQVPELAESAHPLSSYVFMELYSDVKSKDLDVEKVAFFYRNNYSLENSYALRGFSGEALLSFEDLPLSWVMQALIGEEKAAI